MRQPWAWAIIHGGKVIENRTTGSIRAGGMTCRPIAIHAAAGMREKEYYWAAYKMQQIGVQCPAAADLPRAAIIGSVDVVDIISKSESPWFGGPRGLVLENPVPCAPIPSKGALGYFEWQTTGRLAPPAAWMKADEAGLFDALPLSFDIPPEKPFGPKKR